MWQDRTLGGVDGSRWRQDRTLGGVNGSSRRRHRTLHGHVLKKFFIRDGVLFSEFLQLHLQLLLGLTLYRQAIVQLCLAWSLHTFGLLLYPVMKKKEKYLKFATHLFESCITRHLSKQRHLNPFLSKQHTVYSTFFSKA